MLVALITEAYEITVSLNGSKSSKHDLNAPLAAACIRHFLQFKMNALICSICQISAPSLLSSLS